MARHVTGDLRHRPGGHRILDSWSAAHVDSQRCQSDHWSVAVVMTSLFDDLQSLFGETVISVEVDTPHELAILLNGPDARPVVEHLVSQHAARLVAVFAEDRTPVEGLFYNHYVFEQ